MLGVRQQAKDSLKGHEKTLKSWMGNLTGNANKKSTTTSKSDNRKKKRWNIGQKGKSKASNNDNTIRGYRPESTDKRSKIKKYRDRVKQYRQNRTLQNNQRTFYQQTWRDGTKTYQQLDAREAKQLWSKI